MNRFRGQPCVENQQNNPVAHAGSNSVYLNVYMNRDSHLLPLRAFVGLGASGPPSSASPPATPSSALLPSGVVLAPSPRALDEPPLLADGGVAGVVVVVSSIFRVELPSAPKAVRRTDAVKYRQANRRNSVVVAHSVGCPKADQAP